MSWHTDHLKYALGFGGVMSFYGIVGLLSFAADRLIGIELTHASVLYANQW